MPAPHQLPFAVGVLASQLLSPPASLLHHLLQQLLDELAAAWGGANVFACKQQGMKESTSAIQDFTLCGWHLQHSRAPRLQLLHTAGTC